jgi:three-Cys-motif partner protein
MLYTKYEVSLCHSQFGEIREGINDMAKTTETVWPIEEHTKAKHEILSRYLGAWFPILGLKIPRILYIDGFCGPGRYEGGEPGSPVIALTQAMSLNKFLANTEVVFLFIDERCDRIDYLNTEIAQLPLPENFHVYTENNQFDKSLSSILDKLANEGLKLAPTFIFIDPFGWKGIPFDIVCRLLVNQRTEVFVNVMVDSINRFIEHPNPIDRQNIRDVFGVSEERIDKALQSPDRISALRQIYQEQLQKCARFVRYFEMRDSRNKVIYYLFFASNHPLGHKKMKEAFWRVDQQSGYKFSDRTDPNQPVLFEIDPSADLAEFLQRHYTGRVVNAEEVITFVENETPFITKHAKSALKQLENKTLIKVEQNKRDGTKRTRGFPDGVIIHF